MTRSLVVLLALFASVSQARDQSLVGTWRVRYPAGMRMENGEATVTMGTGTLTIQATNDSLVGELVIDPNPDLPARPPAHLAGKRGPGEAVLVSRTKATINMNGATEEAVAVSTWKLQAKGDSLSGTVERKLEGHDMGSQEPRPVTGTRKKQ
jgi:hypothetical protein